MGALLPGRFLLLFDLEAVAADLRHQPGTLQSELHRSYIVAEEQAVIVMVADRQAHLEHLECDYQPHIQGRGAKKRTQRAG